MGGQDILQFFFQLRVFLIRGRVSMFQLLI